VRGQSLGGRSRPSTPVPVEEPHPLDGSRRVAGTDRLIACAAAPIQHHRQRPPVARSRCGLSNRRRSAVPSPSSVSRKPGLRDELLPTTPVLDYGFLEPFVWQVRMVTGDYLHRRGQLEGHVAHQLV
jgi:hypothetical protein